jgi:hypothetical protein
VMVLFIKQPSPVIKVSIISKILKEEQQQKQDDPSAKSPFILFFFFLFNEIQLIDPNWGKMFFTD